MFVFINDICLSYSYLSSEICCLLNGTGEKNSLELQNTFKQIPLDKILIETDSPFLAPEPMRGKINEPAFVKYTADYLSDFFNLSLKEFEKITDNNFFNLFTKAKRDNYL